MPNHKLDNALIGSAGVHFVVSELCLRGLIALPTIRNTAGIDILVAKPDVDWNANLQVKTSKSKVTFWPISDKFEQWKGPFNYYVFVRYLPAEKRFEVFLECADLVIDQSKQNMIIDQNKGLKKWAHYWVLYKNEESRVRKQWLEFGL